MTDHGRPTLELLPYQADARDPLDILRGSVLRYDCPMDAVAELNGKRHGNRIGLHR